MVEVSLYEFLELVVSILVRIYEIEVCDLGSGCHFCSSVYGISSLVADYYLAYTGRTLVLFCFSQENLKVDFLNNDLCALSPIQVYLGVD